ncbi:unnamed protein product [Dibothriocephalus latus]|uniref:Uncharacterized protein n=1 Tax=Dibothriocephalus latus TaxID=60516 RepID=A0A3P6QQA7_DIBLA|nr:unnamed protein product [Dibothriocephalus latus]
MERFEASAVFLSYSLIMLVLSIIMAILRKYILKKKKDTTGFEGLANSGTLVVAFITQFTWVSTFLHSSGFGLRFGISGPVWYSTTAIFPSVLFAVLFTQFRRRAPGARTFLQVSHARFGKTAHMVLCGFALLNNFSILALVISSTSYWGLNGHS